MALSQSVLSELLDAFRAGEGVDLVRDAVRLVMQELIEVEAAEQIGADRYERSDTRTTERNGSRPRLLATQAGDVELKIPKLRKGSVLPVDPRAAAPDRPGAVRGGDGGLRQRGVDPLGRRPGRRLGRRLGDLQVARCRRICAGLDEIVGAFRTRRLDHIEFPYVYLDATYLHVRNSASQVCSMAVVVATGITADGSREVLGLDVGDSEDEVFWRGFLRSLKARGLGGVRLVISDQHSGLVAALKRSLPRHRRINVAASISCATCWPSSPSRIRTWSLRCSARSSPNPTPATVASTWDEVRDQLAARFPKIGAADGRRQSRSARLRRLPAGALDEDLVDEPARAGQQGDQAPLPRRGHLPQRSHRHPPRRSRARRHARRMASRRPPLPLRRLDGRALPDARY